MSLLELESLDRGNLKLALSVMTYRRENDWNDNKFWTLAKYAQNRINFPKSGTDDKEEIAVSPP